MIAVSRDDGLTWRSQQAVPDAGWNLGSVSCADASHCWAAANGFTTEALMGTADGGRSWTSVTQDRPDGNYGAAVSCLSVRVCVATTDARLWVTAGNGGLG